MQGFAGTLQSANGDDRDHPVVNEGVIRHLIDFDYPVETRLDIFDALHEIRREEQSTPTLVVERHGFALERDDIDA